jgi:hypothetical protein
MFVEHLKFRGVAHKYAFPKEIYARTISTRVIETPVLKEVILDMLLSQYVLIGHIVIKQNLKCKRGSRLMVAAAVRRSCIVLARALSVLAFLAAARRSSASFTESVRSLGLPNIIARMLTSKTSLPLPGLSRMSAFPRGKCLASDAGTVGVS